MTSVLGVTIYPKGKKPVVVPINVYVADFDQYRLDYGRIIKKKHGENVRYKFTYADPVGKPTEFNPEENEED